MQAISKSFRRLALCGLAVCSAETIAWDVPSGEYRLEKTHAYITFSYSHLGFSNPHVGFERFDATLMADAQAPENSRIEVSIEAASISSRVAEFDEHLNDEEFFDTEKHPEITFTSTQVKSTGEDTFDVTGDLTIKGVTKPVVLATRINKADTNPIFKAPAIGISATALISRSDWGLGQHVPMVGDAVSLRIEAELIHKQDD